ncbi:MAG: hypothetical protein FWC56_00540 [Phycisphaerae bacterium]|nr:hypothetical protein [Phycisphaerae bacterium]
MKTQIQLILATVGLTILIWVYADQQGYRTVDFSVAIRIATLPEYVPQILGSPTDSDSPGTGLVMVSARGPNAAIRRLNLQRPLTREVTVPVNEIQTIGSQQVDVYKAIEKDLFDRGLQLLSVKPSNSIMVAFDHWEKQVVEVQPDAGTFAEAIKGNLRVEPMTVTAKVLSSELNSTTSTLEKRLILPIEDLLRTQSAQQTEFNFPVPLQDKKWQGLKVVWEPNVVQVQGQLQQRYEDVELKLIPLRVVLPRDWPCDKYQIAWADERDRLQKVSLKVPVGKPRALTNTDVIAMISLDASLIPSEPANDSASATTTQPVAEAEPSPFSRPVRFVFPEGFEDVKLVSPPSEVKFRIVKRPTSNSGLPPAASEGRDGR